MNRGVIMEIGKRHLVVMTRDGEFKKVPKRTGCQLGEEISLLQSAGTGTRFSSLLAVAAAAVLILAMVPRLFFSVPEVVAYVAMDINPSIELGVDRKERVRELRAWNDDGAVVIEGLKYKGMPAEQVASLIMKRVQAGSYFSSGDGDVVITTVFMNEKLHESFMSELTGKVDHAVRQTLSSDPERDLNVEVTVLTAPKDLRDEAALNGVTVGKMAVYLLAKNHGYELSLEELQQDSIHKLTKGQGGLKKMIGSETAADDHSKAALERMLDEEKEKKEKEKQTSASDNYQSNNSGQSKDKDEDTDKNKDKNKNKNKNKDKSKGKEENKGIDKNDIDRSGSNGDRDLTKYYDQDKDKDKDKNKTDKINNAAVKEDNTGKDDSKGNNKNKNGDRGEGRSEDEYEAREEKQEDDQTMDSGKLKSNDNKAKAREPVGPANNADEDKEGESGRNDEDKGGRESGKIRS